MRYARQAGALVAMLVISSGAHAWDCSYWSQSTNAKAECYKPPQSSQPTQNNSNATSTANSQSTATTTQTQHQTQTALANGGSGGDAAANNNGNAQNVNFSSPRSAPSVGQGSLFAGDCGAGGNAGGSNTHGAAFLGMVWTPYDCKLFKAAAAYMALGMADAACNMVNGISAVEKRWKELGMTPPDCTAQHVPVPALPTPAIVNITETLPAAPAPAIVERYLRKDERESRVVTPHRHAPRPKSPTAICVK